MVLFLYLGDGSRLQPLSRGTVLWGRAGTYQPRYDSQDVFYLKNFPPAKVHKLFPCLTGPYYQAAARFGDVIHTSWVFDCIEARELLHVRPK